jgi:hypothetical protein
VKTNRELFNRLIGENAIRLEQGKIFDNSLFPKPVSFDFDRVEGMLLGVAIGDSLGITTEGMLAPERKARFGEIRDYIPNNYVDEAIGFPSDDTQLTFWTLEQMVADNGFVPDHVAKRFLNDRIFGLGSAVREFLTNYCSGRPWHRSGPAWQRGYHEDFTGFDPTSEKGRNRYLGGRRPVCHDDPQRHQFDFRLHRFCCHALGAA